MRRVYLTPEHESSRILKGVPDEQIRCFFWLASPPGPLSISKWRGGEVRQALPSSLIGEGDLVQIRA
jgi:hypothetical protein